MRKSGEAGVFVFFFFFLNIKNIFILKFTYLNKK